MNTETSHITDEDLNRIEQLYNAVDKIYHDASAQCVHDTDSSDPNPDRYS